MKQSNLVQKVFFVNWALCFGCVVIVWLTALIFLRDPNDEKPFFALLLGAFFGIASIVLGTYKFVKIMQELNKPQRVEVLIREVFGENWIAPVLLHRDGRLEAPPPEECVLTPSSNNGDWGTKLGPPYYRKHFLDGNGQKQPLGIHMLGQLYSLPK